ncbi:MAG TPA: putative toxin-antitoxin system toxin component, PIN family [Saprospiraceae bacterium]|nr:putative toxin-antitoxin system toxin component, PIN family [Saprospiraceae bacterium]HPI08293.1 putative toxin-antitoxin system toxin component, PIN family [Saprospiraceae bacterium]
MKVVLDTNVLLAALPEKSNTHVIFKSLLKGDFTLCVTTDILHEYEEVFQLRANREVAVLALDLLDILPNLERINKYYFWNLITADPDDNKFVDCAIAANAHFICTEDKHFKVLENISFPAVSVISTTEFMAILLETI